MLYKTCKFPHQLNTPRRSNEEAAIFQTCENVSRPAGALLTAWYFWKQLWWTFLIHFRLHRGTYPHPKQSHLVKTFCLPFKYTDCGEFVKAAALFASILFFLPAAALDVALPLLECLNFFSYKIQTSCSTHSSIHLTPRLRFLCFFITLHVLCWCFFIFWFTTTNIPVIKLLHT